MKSAYRDFLMSVVMYGVSCLIFWPILLIAFVYYYIFEGENIFVEPDY